MNPVDFIFYIFNGITGLSFEPLTLSELAAQAAGFTYWIQIFDPSFIMSFIVYLSLFFFVWKFTYNLFFRLLMHICRFPRKWNQKN